MRELRHWIAFAVSIILAFSCCLAASATEGGQEELEIDPVYAQSYRFLYAFGIVTNDIEEFESETEVTRGEFAVVVARILGNGTADDMVIPISYFNDMDGQDAETIRAVNLLSDMKLVTGTGGGAYSPDEIMTGDQAIKVLVSLLGYDLKAQEQGGFPVGYLSQGNRLRFIPDGFRSGSNLTWGVAVEMLYLSLHVDIVQHLAYGTEPTYAVVKGETLLTNVMNVKLLKKAVVTGNTGTRLNGSDGVLQGWVELNGQMYREGSSDAGSYLGKTVDVYYTEGRDGIKTVMAVELRGDANALVIDFGNVVSLDGNTIIYYPDSAGNQRRISVASDANMMVNGRVYAYNPALIDTSLCGRIILEKGVSGSYDLVTVEQYTNLLVDAVDHDRNMIYDRIVPGNSLDLTPFIQSGNYLIEEEGEALDITDIYVGLMLAIYKSPDGSYIRISISSDTVSGAIQELCDNQVTMNDRVYDVLPGLLKDIRLGAEYTAYLTVDGKIAYFEFMRLNKLKYGYVIQGANISGLDPVIALRILTEDDFVEVLHVSDRVILNGQRITRNAADKVQNALMQNGVWSQQLIQYKLNDSNEIAELNTAKTQKTEDGDFYIANDKETLRYKSGGMSFNMRFSINANTKVFLVSPTGSIDPEEFQISASSYFRNDYNYTVEAYCTNGGGLAEAVVCWEKINDVSPTEDSAMVLVDYISTNINGEGEVVSALHGLSNGQYVEYLTNGEVRLITGGRDLKRGDVVRVALNRDSEICNLVVDVNIDTQKSVNASFGTRLGWRWAISGVIYSMEDSYALVADATGETLSDIDLSDPNNLYSVKLDGKVMVYDDVLDEIYVGSVRDILPYTTAGEQASRFYARFSYAALNTLFIFKYK